MDPTSTSLPTWLIFLITGLVTLAATFAGVFLAEYKARKREEKNTKQKNKRTYRASIRFLFNEILFNYGIIAKLNKNIKINPPPNNIVGIKFINQFMKELHHEIFIAFISSGAIYSYISDELDNAIQQNYKKIWDIKMNFKITSSIFEEENLPKNEEINKMAEELYEKTISDISSAVILFEENIPIIIKMMKSVGITYIITSRNMEGIDIMEGDNFKRIVD